MKKIKKVKKPIKSAIIAKEKIKSKPRHPASSAGKSKKRKKQK